MAAQARAQLIGTRIRERRIAAGLRQADLAAQAGISASYLNLIEHNKRRIGGKLVIAIAAALGVEPQTLSDGAEAALIQTLREARAALPGSGAEREQPEDLAARFPGWADVLARAQGRIAALERTVEALTDRLTHDPHLAAALHDVISTVTAIRSTAGILVETRQIEPEWRDRFHRNINEDAARLARSAQALVSYLNRAEDRGGVTAPEDELDAYLAARGWHFPEVESGGAAAIATVIDAAGTVLPSTMALALCHDWLRRYAADAAALPLARLVPLCAGGRVADPAQVAAQTGVALPLVMRRLACLPPGLLSQPLGMVSCDASGTLTFRRPVDGFALPRYGAGCPLWPLFAALSQPMVPIRRVVAQIGRDGGRFTAIAVAQPDTVAEDGLTPSFAAHMLLVPAPGAARGTAQGGGADPVQDLGVTCRLCSKPECPARRERSILTDGL